ncbi:zinc ribbon domain-containing protein [Priestia megaterium]|uniref:zinc ribbon domain-containing protein n=1 Tax=Priestia megaterium TaxID=1404 RepID=UPI001FD4E263|nr:zinc ribbon domain-containing protein [Priestia megaterium]
MNQCPKCGASVSTDQLFCNNCGFSFTVSPAAAKYKKSWYIGGGIALILLLTFVFYFLFSSSEEKTADRFIEALESKDTAVLRELLMTHLFKLCWMQLPMVLFYETLKMI